jgi:hypothetical protein
MAIPASARRRARWFGARGAFAALFLGSLLLFFLLLPVPRADGHLIGSDGVYYYIYLRSLAIDGDLDFANEYAAFDLPVPPRDDLPAGRVPNKYAVGPAILWAPFFLAAHGLALAGSSLGLPVAPDGYGALYQAAISIGSIVYGALGFWLACACARRCFSGHAVLLALLLLWLASNAIYYMVFEPSMAHMVALFSVSALLTLWFTRLRGPATPSFWDTLALGAAAGLVPLVRLQDAIFVAIPALWVAARIAGAALAGRRGEAAGWLGRALLAGCAGLLVFSPQLAVWRELYGTWNASPYMAERTPAFFWLAPRIGPVLFSSFHGLFAWHPIYLAALVGLLVVVRRDRWAGAALLLALAANTYVVAAWWAWWQGDSFGGRMFISAMWIWLLGLAGCVEWLLARGRGRLAVVAGALLIVWNALSLAQYRLGFVPMSAPLTWEQMTIERLALPWRIVERLVS